MFCLLDCLVGLQFHFGGLMRYAVAVIVTVRFGSGQVFGFYHVFHWLDVSCCLYQLVQVCNCCLYISYPHMDCWLGSLFFPLILTSCLGLGYLFSWVFLM